MLHLYRNIRIGPRLLSVDAQNTTHFPILIHSYLFTSFFTHTYAPIVSWQLNEAPRSFAKNYKKPSWKLIEALQTFSKYCQNPARKLTKASRTFHSALQKYSRNVRQNLADIFGPFSRKFAYPITLFNFLFSRSTPTYAPIVSCKLNEARSFSESYQKPSWKLIEALQTYSKNCQNSRTFSSALQKYSRNVWRNLAEIFWPLQKVRRNYLNIFWNPPTAPLNLLRGITWYTLLNILNYAIIFLEFLEHTF